MIDWLLNIRDMPVTAAGEPLAAPKLTSRPNGARHSRLFAAMVPPTESSTTSTPFPSVASSTCCGHFSSV